MARSRRYRVVVSQELPLFACTVDRSKVRFRLYSTSAMWLIRYQFGEMAEVKLCPDAHHDPLSESRSKERIGPVENGGGYAYYVPMGHPIVDLTVFDLDKETRKRAIEALTLAIQVEQKNLTFRRLGVHVASRCNMVIPNDPSS